VDISFILRNAAAAQASPAPKVGMVGVPPQALVGSVLSSGGTASLGSVVVEESGNVVKQENTLTFRFKANMPIMQDAIIIISGLTGRQEACANEGIVAADFTKTLPPKEIKFVGAARALQSDLNEADLVGNGTQGLCFDKDGRISVKIPFSVVAGAEIVFFFSTINWQQALPGVFLNIAVSGCIAPLTLQGTVAAVCDASKVMALDPRASKNKVLASGLAPQIVDVEVAEETPVIAQPNILYVQFKLSFRLLVNTQLNLTGFANNEQKSQSPDDLMLELRGDDAHVFGGTASWEQDSGKLTLTAAKSVGPNRVIKLSLSLLNANMQTSAKCAMGTSFCLGGLWEGQPCPVVGQLCAGQCAGGLNFCNDPVPGDCSKFSLPAQQNAANVKCPGGVCVAHNGGRQCPVGSLLSSKGAAGPVANDSLPYGYTNAGTGQFSVWNGAKTKVAGVQCDGGGVCEGTSTCTAPNTDLVCDNHLMCTGLFYPKSSSPSPSNNRGPQTCRRSRIPAEIHLTVTQQGFAPFEKKARGKVYGFTNPEPPQFAIRTISESTVVASATNVLSVLLVTNFELQALQNTSLTLSGFSSTTSSTSRLPLNSAQKHLEIYIDCVGSILTADAVNKHVVQCNEIGASALARDDLIIDARLNVEVQCVHSVMEENTYCSAAGSPSPSCLLFSGVRVGGMQTSGFSTSPCVQRFNCSSDSWCSVIDSVAVSDLLDPSIPTNFAGFLVELNVSSLAPMRVKLDLYYTSEYVVWKQASGEVIVTGRTAPSFKKDDRTLTFSFQLLNDATPRTAQTITIVGASGVVRDIGICDDVIEAGCLEKGKPSTARAVLIGNVLSARIIPTFLSAASISEDSAVQGDRNTLTLKLTPSVRTGNNFMAGSRVTISGLLGSLHESTTSLALVSNRLGLHATWDMTQGLIVAIVTSEPAHPYAPLIFSFTINNPSKSQLPLSPSVLVVGGWRDANAWGQAKVGCATATGCDGVLAGGTELATTMTQLWESTNCINQLNHVSFSLTANVPLQTKTTRLYIYGLNLHAPTPSTVQLLGGDAFIRRAASCKGQTHCSMIVDTRVPSGTTRTKVVLNLQVNCHYTRQIHSISSCGVPLPASAIRQCTSESEAAF